MSTFFAILAVPAFPGKHIILLVNFESNNISQIACSLPPLPINPIFILIYILYNLLMGKKKAKLIFKHNSFEIVEEGDYVVCAISGKKIELKDWNYWTVDLQEPYYSYKEAFIKKEEINKK